MFAAESYSAEQVFYYAKTKTVYTHHRLQYLMEQARSRQATQEEITEMLTLIAQDEEGRVIAALNTFHHVPDFAAEAALTPELYALAKEILAADKLPAVAARRLPLRRWWQVAAAVVLLAGASWLWLQYRPQGKPGSLTAQQPVADTATARGTVLTLSDGRKLALDSLGNGEITAENGTRLVFRNGSLQYNAAAATDSTLALRYNTITTPTGNPFQLTLPDGTRVWLNAVSSLTYPLAFAHGQRQVALTGEGYFEVAANTQAPFIVTNNRLQTQVLGTAFNMKCYDDEPLAQTTLVNGAVRVTKENRSTLLQPGQQLSAAADTWRVTPADMEAVLAWKNGQLQLNNADIATVMRQVARWYDVTVLYPNGVPDIPLDGYVQKEAGLEQAVEILKAGGLHCKLENKTLIIFHH